MRAGTAVHLRHRKSENPSVALSDPCAAFRVAQRKEEFPPRECNIRRKTDLVDLKQRLEISDSKLANPCWQIGHAVIILLTGRACILGAGELRESDMHESRRHQWLQHPADSDWARFCPRCGAGLDERYVEAEQHVRKICSGCGFIFYLNPKVVACAVPCQDGRIWLLRRNIEPSWGSWTFPGGYVDLGECVPDAAIRETYEEMRLNVRLDGLLNLYSYANVGVVLVVYRATVTGGVAAATQESQEVRAFRLEEIPWDKLAFPSTRDALLDYVKLEQTPGGQQ